MKPQRIQRKRTKGWKMPPNTVSVTRPGKWGNPFIISPTRTPGAGSGAEYICVPNAIEAVECFREYMKLDGRTEQAQLELRGKHLACFCKLGDPCHADVLLELANAPEVTA
jgi:hypothetical protein